MKTSAFTVAIVLVLTMSVASARAQEASSGPAVTAASRPDVAITPFVSIDSRASTPIGVGISFPLNPNFSIEAEFGYRRAEGDINALNSSANLLYMLPRIGRVTPYLATGAGLAQYGAPIIGPGSSLIGTQRRTAFEVNAGGGLKIPVKEHWGIRTDARWFKPFDRNASEHWRVSNGVSFDVKRR